MNSVAYLPQSKRLVDQVREVLRYKHYSLKTEQAYLYWIRFFVRWYGRDGKMQDAAPNPAQADSIGADQDRSRRPFRGAGWGDGFVGQAAVRSV